MVDYVYQLKHRIPRAVLVWARKRMSLEITRLVLGKLRGARAMAYFFPQMSHRTFWCWVGGACYSRMGDGLTGFP
jgi:hypothetical protein